MPGCKRGLGVALLDQVAEHTGGTVRKALADRGFKNQVAVHATHLGIDVETAEHNPQDKGFVPQPKRWRVEQTCGILILHRRLVRDYEHRPSSSASRVRWAMTHVMVRRLTGANTPAWRDPRAVSAWTSSHCSTRSRSRRTPPGPWSTALRTQIEELQGRLREAETHLEHLAIARKSITALADRLPARVSPPEVPEHPDYLRILAVFNETTGPLRARDVCEARDHDLLPKSIEGTRAKLKRLVNLDVLTEVDAGSFAS
ncbi:hypothetical protein [Streptomyces sp. AJS327]|uniref:hypothetical protein n=1 Tax=Streptomyces sp. AJS327 TaxID=2545265 RepID=UPI0021556313